MSFFGKRERPQKTTQSDPRTYVVIDRLETVADRMEILATEIEESLRRREAERRAGS